MSCIKVPKIKSYVPEINTSGVLCSRQPTGQDIHAKETASSGTAEGQREVVTMKTVMYTLFCSGNQPAFPSHSIQQEGKKRHWVFKGRLLVEYWFVYLTLGPHCQKLQFTFGGRGRRTVANLRPLNSIKFQSQSRPHKKIQQKYVIKLGKIKWQQKIQNYLGDF